MSAYAWQETPFGPVSDWPISLQTTVSICVNSRFPMTIWWGADFCLLYNDAFQMILGDRHPQALGQPAKSVFAESWHIIGPQLNKTFTTGMADREEDLLIPVMRAGYLEESYYTYSYSPIFLEDGKVGGVFYGYFRNDKANFESTATVDANGTVSSAG
ncbi:MAG: hypothetical protein HC800_05440 [Phormidesmis sp. RL_2_1]|nr:hypothetical protein [Phormidesmis sp. RL_2_1]